MGTLPPTELLNQWRLEKLTVEMTTGHILQNLVKLCESMEHLTCTIHKLRVDVDRLIGQTGVTKDFANGANRSGNNRD